MKLQPHIQNVDSVAKIRPRVPDTTSIADTALTDSFEAQPINSVFHTSEHIRDKITPAQRERQDFDWITVHLLIVLALIAWSRVYYMKRFSQLLKAFFGQRYQGILLREGNVFRERISIPLLLNYLVTFSLFIYHFLNRFISFNKDEYSGFKLFALIILVVLVLWILKNVSTLISGYLFKNPVVLSDYIVTQFIFNINLGIYMLPVVITATYVYPVLALYTGIILWVIVFIYRIFRQFFTGLSYTRFSLFNRFLYLCTFEIAPILVVIKLIMNNLK